MKHSASQIVIINMRIYDNKVINQYQMNFLFIPFIKQVPEWKQCYYDYRTLNKIIKLISKCIKSIQKIQKTIDREVSHFNKQKLKKLRSQIIEIVEEECHYFFQYATQQSKVISMFIQFKLYEIRQKISKYEKLIKIIGRKNHQMLLLIQNLYIESYYLQYTTQINIAQQTKTVTHFNQTIQSLSQYIIPITPNVKLKRVSKETKDILFEMQLLYTTYNRQQKIYPQQYIKEQYEQKIKIDKEPLRLGMIMGALFLFLGFAILINIINNLGLGVKKQFTDNFPVWRGASEVIWYMWVWGLCVTFYEQSGINYKLIFHFQKYHLPHSRYIFMLASIFSFIYLFLLTLYFLQLSSTLHSNFVYYGQIFWLIFFAYIFNPFPILQQKGRFYLLKMLFRQICSFCYPMNFLMIWMAQQFVSLTQPITDLFYTVFFFCSRNSALAKSVTPNFNSAIVITVFLYRMYQNFKFWLQIVNSKPDKKYDFWLPPFLGFCRALFGCLSATTAIFYRLKTFQNAIVLWIFTIVISTCISWYVDIRGDWGLLQHQARFILRQKVLFPQARPLYYFLIVFNLFLRTNWVLTIAPFVVNSTGIWPNLFILIISFIQIFRRGVWNLIRVQFEHVKNCGQYQATIRDGNILKLIQTQAKQILNKKNQQQILGKQSSLQKLKEAQLSENLMNLQTSDPILQNFRKMRQIQVFKYMLSLRNDSKIKVDAKLSISSHNIANMLRKVRIIKVSEYFISTFKAVEKQ